MIPVLHHLFPERLGRLGFALRFLIIIWTLPLFLSEADLQTLNEAKFDASIHLSIGKWQIFGLLAIMIYLFVYIVAPRIYDLGLRRWLALLLMIPYLGPILMVLLAFLPSRRKTQPEIENSSRDENESDEDNQTPHS